MVSKKGQTKRVHGYEIQNQAKLIHRVRNIVITLEETVTGKRKTGFLRF